MDNMKVGFASCNNIYSLSKDKYDTLEKGTFILDKVGNLGIKMNDNNLSVFETTEYHPSLDTLSWEEIKNWSELIASGKSLVTPALGDQKQITLKIDGKTYTGTAYLIGINHDFIAASENSRSETYAGLTFLVPTSSTFYFGLNTSYVDSALYRALNTFELLENGNTIKTKTISKAYRSTDSVTVTCSLNAFALGYAEIFDPSRTTSSEYYKYSNYYVEGLNYYYPIFSDSVFMSNFVSKMSTQLYATRDNIYKNSSRHMYFQKANNAFNYNYSWGTYPTCFGFCI